MSDHYLVPVSYSGTYLPAAAMGESHACETLINMALVGAVVGGSAAAAQNALGMKRDEIEFGEALLSTGRTAIDRKSTRLNYSHSGQSRMPSSA
jgi:hypothetical protein